MKLFEPDVPKEVRDLFEHLSKTWVVEVDFQSLGYRAKLSCPSVG